LRGKSLLTTLAKVLLTVAALYWVYRTTDVPAVLSLIRGMDLRFGLLGVLFVFFGLSLSGIRWWIFLPFKDRVSPLKAVFITLGALFYGMFLPAGAGVDAIRGYYAGLEIDSHSTSFASVFVDRMVGFLALTTIALVALLLGSAPLRPLAPLIVASFALTFFAAVVMLSRRLRHPVARLLQRWGIWGVGPKLAGFLMAFDHYRDNPGKVVAGFLLSFLMQGLLGVGAYFIGVGLHLKPPFVKTVVYTPLVNLITMLPITIGGVGLREGGFIYLLSHAVGKAGAVSMSILYYFANILAASPGFLFIWLASRNRREHQP